jgi:hypothetical protein
MNSFSLRFALVGWGASYLELYGYADDPTVALVCLVIALVVALATALGALGGAAGKRFRFADT